MNQFEQYKDKVNQLLHKENIFNDILAKVELKTRIKRLYITSGLVVIISIWLMVGYGSQFLANFIGFLYPAYCSIKAIESQEKWDDTKWLTYWVVYGFFSLMEFFADIFLWWIPCYSFFKCLFLIYCMVPTSWNGSIFIYYRIIQPFVLHHQAKIDHALEQANQLATAALSKEAECDLVDNDKDK